MRAVRAAAGVLLFVLAAVARSAAPPEQLAWAHGLAAAFDEAKQRKVPVMVVLNMDGERGNDQMVAEVYTAAAVREAAKKLVVTVASMDKHAETDDGKGGRVCSRFGHLTCAEHRATEEVVRKDWLKKGEKDDVDSPRHMFLSPEGKLLFERVWTVDAEELVKIIDRAAACCDPAVLAAWDTPEARLARVSDAIRCVRQCAVRDLVAAKDAAVDEKLFDLVRKAEKDDVPRDVLGAMVAAATPARVEAFKKLLGAPGDAARREAAGAVSWQKGKESYDALAAAFGREKHVETRCVMLRALAVCGGDPSATREFLLKNAKAGDAALRAHAIVALGPWAKDDAVVEALRKMPANDKLPDNLRAAACWTLGLSGKKDLAADLKAAADEKSEVLKRAGKAAIARLSAGAEDAKYLYFRAWVAPLSVNMPDDATK